MHWPVSLRGCRSRHSPAIRSNLCRSTLQPLKGCRGFAHLGFRRDRSKMNSKQYSGEANEEFRNGDQPIVLSWSVRSSLEAATRALFDLGDQFSADFLRPAGEAALVSPDSVCGVFKHLPSLFIDGVAASHIGARRAACAHRCIRCVMILLLRHRITLVGETKDGTPVGSRTPTTRHGAFWFHQAWAHIT